VEVEMEMEVKVEVEVRVCVIRARMRPGHATEWGTCEHLSFARLFAEECIRLIAIVPLEISSTHPQRVDPLDVVLRSGN